MTDGRIFRERRDQLNLKRPEVAARCELTVAQIARIESTGHLTGKEEARLRKALGMSMLEGSDSQVSTEATTAGLVGRDLARSPQSPLYDEEELDESGVHPVTGVDPRRQPFTHSVVLDQATTSEHVRVPEWNGLRAGQPCLVSGTMGCRWRFLNHVTAPSGAVYIEVQGGKKGREAQIRSFSTDRVHSTKDGD